MMTKFHAFPLEILENICWELDDVASIRCIRLVCKNLSVVAARPLFHNFTLYANVDSFARLEAVAGHATYSKHVHCLTYSANMFRYYPLWEQDFEVWKTQAVGLGLGLTQAARDLFQCQFSEGQLQHAHREWQRATESQGKLIRHDSTEDADDPNTRLHSEPAKSAEVKRLSDCLGRLHKLKSIRWQCQGEDLTDGSWRLEASRTEEEPPLLGSLPTHVQQTLVASDPYGSKHRHAKQVLALFAAMNLTPGLSSKLHCLESLEIRGLESKQFLRLFQRDSEDWIGATLMNLKHFSITTSALGLQYGHARHDVVNIAYVETFEKILKTAVNLESLRIHAGEMTWPENRELNLSPNLTKLELGGLVASRKTWDKIFEKLAWLERVSLSFLEVHSEFESLIQESHANHPWASLMSSLMESSTVKQIKLWGTLCACVESAETAVNYDAEVDDDVTDEEDDAWSEEEEEEDGEDDDEDEDYPAEDEGPDTESGRQRSTEDANEDQSRDIVASPCPIQVYLTKESARQQFASAVAHEGWVSSSSRFKDPPLEGLVFTRIA